jgi:hypothetical protein
MTVAVCLRCGEFKHGAWTPCRNCGYTPDDDESLTRHLLVSDHYLSREQLEEVSARVKAGEGIEFPPEVLQAAWVSKATLDKANRGCWIGCIIFLLVVIGIAAGSIAWQLR